MATSEIGKTLFSIAIHGGRVDCTCDNDWCEKSEPSRERACFRFPQLFCRLRPGQALVVKIQGGRELTRLQDNVSHLRSEVERLTALAAGAAKRDPLPGATLAGPADARQGDRRPATVAGIAGRRKRQACGQVRVEGTIRE